MKKKCYFYTRLNLFRINYFYSEKKKSIYFISTSSVGQRNEFPGLIIHHLHSYDCLFDMKILSQLLCHLY